MVLVYRESDIELDSRFHTQPNQQWICDFCLNRIEFLEYILFKSSDWNLKENFKVNCDK